jgi:hypothetical protein
MKIKRVIYNEFYNEHKIKIINHLYNKYNWQPVLTLGLVDNKNVISYLNKYYPSCVTTNSINLRRAQFDYSKFNKLKPLDSEILSSLSNYALNYLSNLPDSNGNNFSFEERKNFYFDILRYWNTVIFELKPEILISYVFPHTPACLSLYLLCKHHYDIKTLFIDPYPLLNKKYHMIGSSVERRDEQIRKLYKSDENLELGLLSKNFLRDIRSKQAEWPEHMKYSLNFLKETSGKSKRFKEFFRIILKTIKNGYGFKIDSDWKKNTKPYDDIKSRMNNIEYFFFIEKIRQKNFRLKKKYDDLVSDVDYKKKYIYFAAQYQPEATTSQIGGYYENFFLALDILSDLIPTDWVIYFKENPVTFSKSSKILSSLKRNENYYKKIIKKKNIKLISSDTDTFDLIDGAQFVSTITGTVAWEAAVRGVPSISFGRTWYSGCDSILFVQTHDDVKKAIEKIIQGYKPNQKDIERYTAAIEKISSKKLLRQRTFKDEIKNFNNPDGLLEEIAEAFHDAYLDQYAN